ncbi:MAG: toll/interleukin-1 receptor domain-containing protein [Patulibacter sp.]|nr:toll/interleukin-1 receptor domain-containing protein [Patulibacter sp.]
MTVDRVAASPSSLRALISYSHADGVDNAVLLAQELRLRGFDVVRDLENFRSGRSLSAEMDDAIEGDAVLAHLGPHALDSAAVVDKELNPALRAFKRTGRPTVVLLAHGIGKDRVEADQTVAGRLEASFQTTWSGTFAEDPGPLAVPVAQDAARDLLKSVFGRGRGVSDGGWELLVATRGTTPHFEGLVLDATALMGRHREVGSHDDWARVARGLSDLQTALGAHSARRAIRITPQTHLSSAILSGLNFSRAGRWKLSVATQDDETIVASYERALVGVTAVPPTDGAPDDRRLFVGADLAGRDVAGSVNRLTRRDGALPGQTLLFERGAQAPRMTGDEIASTAAAIAWAIRQACDKYQPERLDLFLAVPAAAAVLIGHELDTLDVPIGLWEHEAGEYRFVLEYPYAG